MPDTNPFESILRALPPAPRDRGRVALIVLRPEPGERRTPREAVLQVGGGVAGDRWSRRRALLPGRYAGRDVSAIRADVARALVGDQPPELTGDNLHLELDLSVENLPVGSRLRVGEALLEVSPKPHLGCGKFGARFGEHARRANGIKGLKPMRIRGIMLRVVEGGRVRVGDAVEVCRRAR